MKIIVYSVNTGGYDSLRELPIIDKNVRYILFTDNKYFKSKNWEVNHIDFISHLSDNRRIARFLKINSHLILPEHDYSVWIDNCFLPKIDNFTDMIKKNDFENVMCYKHDIRTCLYDEANVVIENKLDFIDIIKKQISKYSNEGFPKKFGLFSTGFMVRKNNNEVKKFNESWSNEIEMGSARDQLSQSYSSWKTKVKINNFKQGISVYNNPYLDYKIKHINKWQLNNS